MKNSKLLSGSILFIALAILSISCKPEGPVYDKSVKMKNYTWDRFDQKLFEIPIEDTTLSYDITMKVSNTAQFQYDELPVYVILRTPSGEERMREITVPVRNNGKMIGVPTGNLFETSKILWRNISIAEIGNCKISIENMIPKIQTEGIDGIGIVVTESE